MGSLQSPISRCWSSKFANARTTIEQRQSVGVPDLIGTDDGSGSKRRRLKFGLMKEVEDGKEGGQSSLGISSPNEMVCAHSDHGSDAQSDLGRSCFNISAER